MAKKGKLRPGKGAKASILTRMINPPQPIQSKDHRSDIILAEQFINVKGQKCYRFRYVMDVDNGPLLYSLARWVRMVQEGNVQDFFDPQTIQPADENEFIEPPIKWKNSKAKRILYKEIMKGNVPKEARDAMNRSTMALRDIYDMHPEEFHQYDYDKFSSRLSSLRKTIRKKNTRASDDKIAFDLYVANHQVSYFSSKGYIQWQGSDAQKMAKINIVDGKLTVGHQNYLGYKALFNGNAVYYQNFDFDN